MLNQFVCVGRTAKDLEVRENENGHKITYLTLAVPRSFKNADGEYETDLITCIAHKSIGESVASYIKRGDLVGIKGRLQNKTTELEDGTIKTELEVVAEKVSFLSRKED